VNILTAAKFGAVIFNGSDELIDGPFDLLFGLVVVPKIPSKNGDQNENNKSDAGLHAKLSIWSKLKSEPFQILRFRQGCNDGVVKSLKMIVDHPKGSLPVDGGTLHAIEKKLASCVMGTAEGRQDATLI
jgi:hypothetical protein